MKKGAYSKFIVVLVIFLNVAFTVSIIFILPKLAFEPSTLIASWFTFTTTELLTLAYIKKQKIKKGGSEGE
ncbi:MAG: hypothetical protein ABFD25_03345 [Clostridiaceae bacterium]